MAGTAHDHEQPGRRDGDRVPGLGLRGLHRRELQPRPGRRAAGGGRLGGSPSGRPAGHLRDVGRDAGPDPPLVASAAGKPVLGKKSLSAFATTNLDEMLREAGIGQLIIAGVATSGTVLSTTRWAVDTGYRVTVCADACADPEPGAHAALLDDSVFPRSWLGLWRIAQVLPAARISELGGSAG